MATLNKNITPTAIEEFTKLATDQQIERTSKALEANGIQVLIAENGDEAKRLFFELVPDEAEVFLGSSVTLEKLGIQNEIDKSGRLMRCAPRCSQ
jgi:L-lactate utilization protein LutB